MINIEKDPIKCQALREIERELFSQLKENQKNQEVASNNLKQARDKHSTFSSELLELQKNLIVSATGTLDSNISVRIAYLESEIREMLPKIAEFEFILEKYKSDQSRLENDARANATQISGLDCLTD